MTAQYNLPQIEKMPDREERLKAYLDYVFKDGIDRSGVFFSNAFEVQSFISESPVESPWMWDAFHDALSDRLHLENGGSKGE